MHLQHLIFVWKVLKRMVQILWITFERTLSLWQMDDLDIETLAAIAGLSPSYFSRCFAKAFSYSPKAYIAMVRMSKAKMRLQHTLDPIKRMAADVGYNCSSTFCDAFKRETGMTPNEYHAAHLGYKEGFQNK